MKKHISDFWPTTVDLGSAKNSAYVVNQGSFLEEKNSHSMFRFLTLEKEWLLLNISQSEEILIVN